MVYWFLLLLFCCYLFLFFLCFLLPNRVRKHFTNKKKEKENKYWYNSIILHYNNALTTLTKLVDIRSTCRFLCGSFIFLFLFFLTKLNAASSFCIFRFRTRVESSVGDLGPLDHTTTIITTDISVLLFLNTQLKLFIIIVALAGIVCIHFYGIDAFFLQNKQTNQIVFHTK